MTKSDLYNMILGLVETETEVPSNVILSPRKDSETVDARYLLVHFLLLAGLTPSYIARKSGISERTVSNIQVNYEAREKSQKFFRIQSENIAKKLRNN